LATTDTPTVRVFINDLARTREAGAYIASASDPAFAGRAKVTIHCEDGRQVEEHAAACMAGALRWLAQEEHLDTAGVRAAGNRIARRAWQKFTEG